MPDLAYVNGSFLDTNDAAVSINDRGFLFGDAVYEVLRAYGSKPFLVSEHIARLRDGCTTLGIEAEEFISVLPNILRDGLQRSGYSETMIYVHVSRGVQPRNLIYPENLKPTCVVSFRETRDEAKEKRSTGVAICLRPDVRWGYCNLKTTNLLPNVIYRNEAHRSGFYEAALYNEDQTVSECCSATLFIIKSGAIITPPHSPAILPGVSRNDLVHYIAPRVKIPVTERSFTVAELLAADEVFITATSFYLLPVVRVETTVIGNGQPGPITNQLMSAIAQRIAEARNA